MERAYELHIQTSVRTARESFPELFEESDAAEMAGDWFRREGIDSVLDMGCGIGRDAHYFAEKGFLSFGIDRAEEEIVRARSLWTESNPLFMRGDMRQLPFTNNSFDALYGNRSFHFLQDEDERRKTVDEMYRIMRPDGLLFLTVFSTDDNMYGRGIETSHNTFMNLRGHTLHFFEEAELKKIFREFKIEELVEREEVIGMWSQRPTVSWYMTARKRIL